MADLRYMVELEEHIRNAELPSVYKALHHDCKKVLVSLKLPERLDALAPLLSEKPQMYSSGHATDKKVLMAAQFLRQGRRFIELGLQSEDEIKPLLLYYGVAQTCGFLVRSICNYPLSTGHGINVRDDLSVQILSKGSFVRLLDVCSLLGIKSLYSKYHWDESQSRFVESTSDLRYPYSVARPLETIYEDFATIVRMTPSSERNASFDHAAYLLLFIASYLARYRPEKWKRIVDGSGDEQSMVAYNRVMKYAPELRQKMASAIFVAAAIQTSPRDVLNAGSMRDVESIYSMGRALRQS